MTPPDDIINDVVAFDPERSDTQRPKDGVRDTAISDSEESDEEIKSFANQCR
jgi:hypothetical protein